MSEVRGVRGHQIKLTNTLSGVLGTPLTMGSVASNPGVQGVGQSLASLQYMALQQQQQQQQQYMALQQQYLPQHDTAFNGTVIGTQGRSTKVKIILNTIVFIIDRYEQSGNVSANPHVPPPATTILSPDR